MPQNNETRGTAIPRASETVVGRDRSENKQDTQSLQLRWLTQRLKLSAQHACLIAELLFSGGRA
jgi:hypothetical protein